MSHLTVRYQVTVLIDHICFVKGESGADGSSGPRGQPGSTGPKGADGDLGSKGPDGQIV